MKFFTITLLALVALCAAAPQQQQQPQFNFNNYLASQTTTPAPIIHPPAKVHYVNIGQELNGDYKFGYDTGSGVNGQSFREETRLADGTVKGQYGYLDAQNKMRLVKYTAGVNGFSIDSDTALNDEQIKASHYVPQAAQAQPQAQPQELPSIQRQQPTYSARQSFQGLASSASSPYAQTIQQPYSGYQNAYQSPYQNAYSNGYQNAPSQIPQYNPSNYGNSNLQSSAPQMTVEQLQQQAIANARARQAALSRQAQQEAIIINQQKAATQAILALQQKAGAPLPPNQPAIQSVPQSAPQPAPQQAPQPAPQAYQTPFNNYQPAQMQSYSPKQTTVTEQRPDVLSNFIQLPGVKLIQIDKPRKPKSAQPLGFGLDANAAKQEEENQGSVVINAALLSYNIGTNQAQATSSKKA